MAMTTAAVLTTIAIAATVVGAGVSAYGQYQSGKTQNAIAAFNAKQQEANTRAQVLGLQAQAALKAQEAQANFQLRSAESQARLANAQAIEQQALAQDKISAVNLQKRREEFGRLQSTQRASIAASGVVESSGTPLDLLAETAARIQQDQEEQHYTNELQRRTLFSEAAQERLGGRLALVGATIDRNSGLATAALTRASAEGAYWAGMREAQITRLSGQAARTAANYEATATLLSGVSQGAGSIAKIS